MKVHKNARLTPRGRERLVKLAAGGQTSKAIAEAVGVCPRTARKWLKRYEAEGGAGLQDRSSRPHRLHRPTPQPVIDRIEALRRQRLTGKAIAAGVGVSPATVSRVLRRLGLNKLSALEPEPVRRYERENPGELIHLDIKKLGRIGSVGHRITGRKTGVVNPSRHRLGVCSCLHRRCFAYRLQPHDEGRKEAKCCCLPQSRGCLLRKPGCEDRARHDRQRLLLSFQSLWQSVQAARPQTHLHQALHAKDERKGRALHPDELARVGLRACLQHFRRTNR